MFSIIAVSVGIVKLLFEYKKTIVHPRFHKWLQDNCFSVKYNRDFLDNFQGLDSVGCSAQCVDLCSLFLEYAQHQQRNKMELLLHMGVDVNCLLAPDYDHYSSPSNIPLYTISHPPRSLNALSLLLHYSPYPYFPFEECVELLLQFKIDINSQPGVYYNNISLSVSDQILLRAHNQIPLTRLLCENGADICKDIFDHLSPSQQLCVQPLFKVETFVAKT